MDAIQETKQKVDTVLLSSIEEHVKRFSQSDGLDFLHVKNTLLLSYLIDLVVYIRDGPTNAEASLQRLNEMKTVISKSKAMDKKLRYQIDKLLAANTTASSFASTPTSNSTPEDPLLFRPDLRALEEEQNETDEDGDDDIGSARATLSARKEQKSGRKMAGSDHGKNRDGVYRAPRLTAVPYTEEHGFKEKEKEKRARRRLRATELAQTLRSQYGDAPEVEDALGGSDYGKQRAAARRLAEREAEKTKHEENSMVRLMVTRKEKKDRKRQMNMEGSNLAAITDLKNLVRETQEFGREDRYQRGREDPSPEQADRYENGKRKRGPESQRRKKAGKSRNSLQDNLFVSEHTSTSNRKRNKR